ncbi:hypothetical protein [Roseiterribacter gracilis]|uniref:Hydrolase n=1 Tax=Roseiterribacter gracilis TaxID=2812848 RepID=A0A8S8XD17_9PROT|nr:hypothetical protein TMPK1_13630 [Rhodospirillales bacterium TMPK1]
MRNDDTKARLRATYHLGATPIFAAKCDPRFSFALYVPHRFAELDHTKTTIVVAVHGTGRMQSLYRDLFAEFAEYNNCIVLAPLFPAGVRGDENLSGYKYILEGDIRYDLVMLGMIDEVAARYGVSGARVLMFGFSGGGHFTHRFAMLHPGRIRAASIGAPGSVTLLDRSKGWWAGIADCRERLGIDVDLEKITGMKVHLVVGEADTETWEITFAPGDRYWVEGANDAGRTRGERAQCLAESFRMHGASVRLDLVAGAAHDVTAVAQKSREFFVDVLRGAV